MGIFKNIRSFRVLYFSVHRFEHGTFWPNLRESDCDFIGEGPGEGFNFNVPLNKTGLGDVDYLAIFHHVLLPVAVEVIFLELFTISPDPIGFREIFQHFSTYIIKF